MSKLLFIYERDMPTISITRDIFTHLKDSSIVSQFVFLSDVTPAMIDKYDVIVFMRPNDIYSWKIGQAARKAGHTVVTFSDDDLLNLTKTSPRIPWRKRGLKKALANSDVIWSSSQYILDKYVGFTAGKRKAHSDTIVREEELTGIDIKHAGNEKVKIVYAAGAAHEAMFEAYIKPILPELMKEYGHDITLTFVSVHPDVGEIACEYVSSMPLKEYRKYMKEQHFDIGISPLYDNQFTKCKYFNKFIEYTTHGTLGIYSRVEPYTYVIKDGMNGLLVDNTPEAWLAGLKRAISDKNLRDSCVQNAIEYLRKNHTEEAIIKRLEEGIPEIKENHKEYQKCGSFRLQKILYTLSRPLDWIYLAGFYLRQTGIHDVVFRAKRLILGTDAYARNRRESK